MFVIYNDSIGTLVEDCLFSSVKEALNFLEEQIESESCESEDVYIIFEKLHTVNVERSYRVSIDD